MTTARHAFRGRIAEIVDAAPEDVTLFAKGRVALYAILRALGVGANDEVILPAFTCVAVPNAILYAGARPVYVDIDPATYTIDPAAVEAAITDRTRVILAQNTFGLSADLETLAAIADRHGLTIVDDCTHGLGGRYRDRPNGSIAPLSFFSTQWSKPLSTGLGGFAVARDGETAARLRGLEAEALQPPTLRSATLRALVFGAEHAGHGRAFRAGRSIYRRLSALGVVPASSSREELTGFDLPPRFLTGLAAWQARIGLARIPGLADDVARRRSIAARYTAWLGQHGRQGPVEQAGTVHSFLRYPLQVDDRPAFIAAAEQAGIDLGDWFVSPIHPVTTGLEQWGYRTGMAPVADAVCEAIVNLPTEPRLTEREIDGVLGFLAARLPAIR